MVPRKVARISEYVAKSGWSPVSPDSGAAQVEPCWAGAPTTCGSSAPAGRSTWLPAATVCGPGSQRTAAPSTTTSTDCWTSTSASVRTSTEVAAGKVGGASAASAPRPPSRPCQITSSTIAGTAIAVSFTQYWKAWTKVMLRIPPTVTLSVTTTPTTTAPTQAGAPVTVDSVSPAPCSCGTR